MLMLISNEGQSGDHNWKKNRRFGRERDCKPRSISLSYSSLSFCSTMLACCTSKAPSPLKKEICVFRLKIHRWWNMLWREECAMSLLASRDIKWTHFLLPFAGDQQKENSSSLLGPRGRYIPERTVFFGVWCRAGIGSCWRCLCTLHQLMLLSCYMHWPRKRQLCCSCCSHLTLSYWTWRGHLEVFCNCIIFCNWFFQYAGFPYSDSRPLSKAIKKLKWDTTLATSRTQMGYLENLGD